MNTEYEKVNTKNSFLSTKGLYTVDDTVDVTCTFTHSWYIKINERITMLTQTALRVRGGKACN